MRGAPDLSTIALRRLFLPFGSRSLAAADAPDAARGARRPRKVARGDAFTLAVAIGPGERMPASAQATYRFEDGETETESLRAVEGGIFRGRIESVNRPFTFSVAAGDDSTSIRNVAVKVVPPPTLKDLTVRLFVAPVHGPRAARRWRPGRNQIRAVIGTRIDVDGAGQQADRHAPTCTSARTTAGGRGRARRRRGPA